MKELVENNYDLKVIGFIKVTEKVYKIKSDECFYYLKFCDDNHLDDIIDYIQSVHLKCFVDIIKNKKECYVTEYLDKYFYIMEELLQSSSCLKEIKIKNYFEMLSYIHKHSCYNLKVNKEYFKKIYNDISKVINERIYYYDSLMSEYEIEKYKSPSQWLFILNYYRLYNSLHESIGYLKRYMLHVENTHIIRVSLIYKNFNYNHIFLKNRRLISLDKIQIDLPIFDIYDIYQRLPDILFDLDCFSDSYLSMIQLNEDEILLLSTLLKITPIISFDNDEISNIIKISRLLYYIDSINSLCSYLDKKKV